MVLGRQLVDGFEEGAGVGRVHFGGDAVAEVEDVAGALSVGGEDAADFVADGGGARWIIVTVTVVSTFLLLLLLLTVFDRYGSFFRRKAAGAQEKTQENKSDQRD